MKIKALCFFFFFLGLASVIQAQTLSVDDPVSLEGDSSDSRSIVFTVTRSGDLEKTSTVKYKTANGTAFSGSDYEAKSGILVFDFGVQEQTIEVRIYGDPIDENDETFFVNLSAPTNATIAKIKGQATIQNDDDPPTVSIEDATFNEGNASAIVNLKVILSQESSKKVTVKYKTENDTAVAPGDYTAKSGILTFMPGIKTLHVPVTVVGDVYAEPDESFVVNLYEPVNATILKGQSVCTLLNDDTALTLFSIDDPSVQEGESGEKEMVFTVSISGPIKQTCSVDYKTADGTAKVSAGDYRSKTGTVIFPPDETGPKTFSVVIYGDKAREPDETLLVNLSNVINGKIMKAQGKGTIQNDDAPPQISLGDVVVKEPNPGATAFANFTVTLSAPSHETITVNYQTENGSATGQLDYVPVSGKLTFAPGVMAMSINVTIKGDSVVESNEVFFVNLSGETNGTIADGQGTCLIKGNDSPEMDVEGKGTSITDGDMTPDENDDTDFGSVHIDADPLVHTFTIKNTGAGSLHLDGNPQVSITGPNTSEFTVIKAPESPIAPGMSTTFEIAFDPVSTGLKQAMVKIVNNDLDENPYDFAIQGNGKGAVPEMNVQGNGQDILDGDTTPGESDHTDFGGTLVSSGTIPRTFTIQNTGAVNLNLPGDPRVAIGGANASDFTVSAYPSSAVLPDCTTTFTILFDPSGPGTRSATVSIENDDSDENPYNFSIQGTGIQNSPEMYVQGNGQEIADGDTTPSESNHTDFGNVPVDGGTTVRIFTIQNLGDMPLNLTGTPKVSIGGNHASEFKVTLQPSTPVVAGKGSTTFQITFDPLSSGARSATVNIANDDGDENPYNFAIQGTGFTPDPEINLQGNGQDIAHEDETPDENDHTDFGLCGVNGENVTRSFTLQNLGSSDLHLTGSPLVALTGAHASDFNVVTQPSPTISPGSSTSFQVKLDPRNSGVRTAIVSIASDDEDESPYRFTIQGRGNPADLDLSFNGTGKVPTPINSGFDELCYDIALHSDGKIVAVGMVDNGTNFDAGVAQYHGDGSLDLSFRGTGKATTPVGSHDDTLEAVAIQADGKIVVAGHSSDGINHNFVVMRYLKNGYMDGLFGTSGKVVTPVGSSTSRAFDIAIQPDGKIAVAGYACASNIDFAVVRYNSDGSLDSTFGSGGKAITAIGSGEDMGQSMAIQSDGNIVVAGHSHNGSNYDFAVVRYISNGSLDTTFNGSGKVVTSIGSGDEKGQAVAVQPDGKIVVAGYSHNGSDHDFAVVRYNSDGSLDNTFGNDGKVTTPIVTKDEAYSVALQNDGKIVVAGKSRLSSGDYRFATVRYHEDGSLDTSFNGTGIVTTPISEADSASSVVIQEDGKILLGGSSYNQFDSDYFFTLVRYLGEPDETMIVSRKDGYVELSWKAGPDDLAIAYNLYASNVENGEYHRINAYPIPAEKITREKRRYTFRDPLRESDEPRFYKLETILPEGQSRMSRPVQ